MQAWQLIFKAGGLVTVYQKDEPEFNAETMAYPPIDLTANLKNEIKWAAEHRNDLIQKELDRFKCQCDLDKRCKGIVESPLVTAKVGAF